MSDNQDWRLRRAAELGLEFYHDCSVQRPKLSGGPAAASSPVGSIGRKVEPSGDHRVPVHSTPHHVESGDRLALAGKIARDGHRRLRPASAWLAGLRSGDNGRALPYAAGAVFAALAASGMWFAKHQGESTRVQPPPPVSAAFHREPTVAPANNTLARTQLPDQRAAVTQAAAPPVSCASPLLSGQLRTAAAKQLRKPDPASGFGRSSTIMLLGKGRIKATDTAGALTICTAGLVVRSAGRTQVADFDYAVEMQTGGVPHVVPIGFDYGSMHGAGELADQKPEAPKPARPDPAMPPTASRPEARTPPHRVEAAGSQDIVIVNKTPSLPTTDARSSLASPNPGLLTAPGSHTLFSDTADTQPTPAEKPPACQNPATPSLSITCTSRSLLALNAQVTGLVAKLSRPGNARRLAAAKRHADRHFDRCTTASCVAKAYHYWYAELANIAWDGGEAGGSGNAKGSVDRP